MNFKKPKYILNVITFLALAYSALAGSLSFADEDKVILSRGEDKLAKVFVNVAGTSTESASFGDPANCATSGATVCSGTYTPTVTNINCTSVSNTNVFQFFRVNNVVNLSGHISAANCVAGTTFKFSAPITPLSNFSSETEGSGQATWNANDANNTGTCKAFVGGTTLAIQRRSDTTGNAAVFVNCTYRIQ